MGILSRFGDIVQANVNAVLDKMEDPSKMIDQYLRELNENLAEVKKETAGVMAEETRTRRLMEENQAEAARYEDLAKQALLAGNEGDAKVFLAKKQQLESAGAGLVTAYTAAHENAVKMRQMHDKLVSDIEALKARRATIKATVSVAKTQERMNKITSNADKAHGAMGAFDRMEDKANRMLDEANAMAELNTEPVDEAKALEEKYSKGASNTAVDAELDALKKGLAAAFGLLKSGGRLSVITFHSLEDRIVKQQMNKWCEGCTCPKDFPVCVCGNKPKGKLIYKKGLAPSEEELRENPRARSARLRVIEKL